VVEYLSILRDTADKLDPTGVKAALEMNNAELKRTKCLEKTIEVAQAELDRRSRDNMPVYEFDWTTSGYTQLVLTVVEKDKHDVVLAMPLFFKSHQDDQKRVSNHEGTLVLSQKWFRDNGLERGREYVVVARFIGMPNPAGHTATNSAKVVRRIQSSNGNTIPDMPKTLGPSDGTVEFPLVWDLPR
jgi:hypothetical protein